MENFVLFNDMELGQKVSGLVSVVDIDSTKKTKNGRYYQDISLKDANGDRLSVKIWDIVTDPDSPKFIDEEAIVDNGIAKIWGEVSEYRGDLQIDSNSFRIEKVELCLEEHAPLIDSTPFNVPDMLDILEGHIQAIEHPGYKEIVEIILDKYYDDFITFPAAIANHHDILGGLLEHTVHMLMIAEGLADINNNFFSARNAEKVEQYDKDLIRAGIILHDSMKVREYVVNQIGAASEFTFEGTMLGHIPMAAIEITKVVLEHEIDISEEDVALLQNAVLSHHGKEEWGSPVKPATPAAWIIHQADTISAGTYKIDRLLKGIEEGEVSEREFTLDNAAMYKKRES